MKYNKIYYILVSAILLTVSCTKEDNTLENKSEELNIFDLLSQATTTDYSEYDKVIVAASSIHGKTAQVNISRDFPKSVNKSKELATTKFYVNNKLLESNNEGITVITRMQTELDEFLPYFGQNITFKVQKKSTKGYTTTTNHEVYNPKLIKIDNKNELKYFSKSKDLTVKWMPDMINDKPIGIMLVLRRRGTGSEIPKNIYIFKAVNDLGSFTFNADDLSAFPNDGMIDIIISRGNQKVVENKVYTLYNSDLVAGKVLK